MCRSRALHRGLEQAPTTRRLIEEQLATAQTDPVRLRSEEEAAKDAYNLWKSEWATALPRLTICASAGLRH